MRNNADTAFHKHYCKPFAAYAVSARRVVGIIASVDIKLGAVFLYVAIAGVDDEWMAFVLCHKEISLSLKHHLTAVACEGKRVG